MRELDFDFLRERFSPEAQQVISVSIEKSRRRNHNFLSEDHVLLALCKKEQKLLQNTVCCSSLKIENLTVKIKSLLDSTKPYVGRSFRMTPELKRTIRTAWEDISETGHKQIETFDLLSAIEKNGTAGSWEMIKKTGLPEAEFHQRLTEYRRDYPRNKDNFQEPVRHRSRFSQHFAKRKSYPSNKRNYFLWFGSLLLLSAIVAFSIVLLLSC